MKHTIRRGVVALLLVSMIAGVSAQGTRPPDADLKEIASYKLTMETVEKVKVATRAMIAEIKKDPKYQQLLKLEAEIEALEKKDDRTDAEDAKLAALNEDKEKLESASDGPLSLGQANSLSEMEANIRKSPPIANALQSAGMSPREYSTFMMAMIQASMVAGFKKAGMMKELPKDVNPENVKFIEEHEAELKAMQAEFEKLAKGGN